MKNFKRIASLLLAMTMILCMAMPIFADGEETGAKTYTIKINETTTGYTYSAYQIFAGTLSEKDGKAVLSNITWGSGIDADSEETLMTALKALEFDVKGENDTTKEKPFAECQTAADVAEVLSAKNTGNDNEVAKAFAQVVGDFLSTTKKDSTEGTGSYTISGLEAGYYLVMNTKVPEDANDETYTRYILEVVKDVDVTHKGEAPKVEKKIVEDSNRVEANTADIGKKINYEIKGTMPSNIADYNTYYYVFTDTMSKGLTLTNPSDIKVTVNGIDVTKYFYIDTKTATDTGITTIKVGISDILALNLLHLKCTSETEHEHTDACYAPITANTEVVITYSAILNEKAVVGVNGNTNDVILDYSNDPNHSGTGTTTPPSENREEPETNKPTGETPKDTVITYTTEIELTKVDAKDGKTILTGAKFKISGTSNTVLIINKEMYVEYGEDESKVEGNFYYRLKDGKYTTTEPVFEGDTKNSDSYDIPEGVTTVADVPTYKKIEVLTSETVENEFVSEGWVDATGKITFTGLGEGTYTIEEIVAPDGYNLLQKPITIVVSSNAGKLENVTADTKVTWSTDGNDEDSENDYTVTEEGKITLKVENNAGSNLPSTGGIGTTIFYIVGGVLLAGAVVLLITKRRMSIDE